MASARRCAVVGDGGTGYARVIGLHTMKAEWLARDVVTKRIVEAKTQRCYIELL